MSAEREPAPVVRSALAGFGLTDVQLSRLDVLLRLLACSDHAPTAVRAVEDAVRVHVADSLAGLAVDELRAARTIADVGTGAGFPGLALAIALPDAETRLLESQVRKCEFVRAAAAAALIENVRIICRRAEQWGEGIAANDAVVARALARQPVVLEYAAPLLRVGGVLVDWRGRRDDAEERAASDAASTLGLARTTVLQVYPFEDATDRHLHVFVKERETPPRFPRRPGIARKRPLGAL